MPWWGFDLLGNICCFWKFFILPIEPRILTPGCPKWQYRQRLYTTTLPLAFSAFTPSEIHEHTLVYPLRAMRHEERSKILSHIFCKTLKFVDNMHGVTYISGKSSDVAHTFVDTLGGDAGFGGCCLGSYRVRKGDVESVDGVAEGVVEENHLDILLPTHHHHHCLG